MNAETCHGGFNRTFSESTASTVASTIESSAEEKSDVNSEVSLSYSQFCGHQISQVLNHPTTLAIYKTSNRGSVIGGVVCGAAGALLGPSTAFIGMTVGSSLGGHVGTVTGGVAAMQKPEQAFPGIEMVSLKSKETLLNESSDEVASVLGAERNEAQHQGNIFSNRVIIEVTDHAGHHAAMGSIATGVIVFVASLATGNPLLAAAHVAGVYSGAAWSFGLTTGATHWLLNAYNRRENGDV